METLTTDRTGFADLHDGAYAIGIDIGGTKMLGVAVDERGRIIASTRIPTERGRGGVVAGVGHAVRALGIALPGRRPRSVGIGVPGLVDPERGHVSLAVNVGLEECALRDLVEDAVGVATSVDNDVAVAALGEADADRTVRSLALVSIGTGLAVGHVVDGRASRGGSAAGEIGHLPVEPDGPLCGCGQRGCLVLYLSGSGIARMTGGAGAGAQELADRVSSGDESAAAVFDLVVERLVWAVQLLALTIDPDRILIGGGVAGLGTALMEPVLARMRRDAAASRFVASLRLDERRPGIRTRDRGRRRGAIGHAVLSDGSRPLTGAAECRRPARAVLTVAAVGRQSSGMYSTRNRRRVRERPLSSS
ncbi:ROK family protein [Microbacterium sp. NPDC089318]